MTAPSLLKEAARSVNQEGQPCFLTRYSLTPQRLPPTVAFAIPPLARAAATSQYGFMRGFVGVLIVALVGGGIYYFYAKSMPSAVPGTAPTQAISLTGVQSDLLQIARAERMYLVSNDHCASLEELISSDSMSMKHSERDGYTYSIDCSGSNFTVAARHPPSPEGSLVHFPTMVIDQTMQVRTTD